MLASSVFLASTIVLLSLFTSSVTAAASLAASAAVGPATDSPRGTPNSSRAALIATAVSKIVRMQEQFC